MEQQQATEETDLGPAHHPGPAAPDSAARDRAEFGRRLQALRRRRGWTLADLSERSGLAISTISKAERGVMAPTYDRMAQLAAGLGVDMTELFTAAGAAFAPGSIAVARRGDHGRSETEHYVYEMLFPEIRNKAMTPMTGVLKAHDTVAFAAFVRHPGQEFLTVLEGRVTVHLEGRPPVVLGCGDSLYFDSAIGHLYASAGETDARILVVCTAPAGTPAAP